MKKLSFILMLLVSVFGLFITACSSSDDNAGSKDPCESPAYHVAASYKGIVSQKEATLTLVAIDKDKVEATLTFINKKQEEEKHVVAFNVQSNFYCEELGLDYITEVEGSESNAAYLVLFKFKEENSYIEFFTLESLQGEFPTIIFERGKK